MENKYGIVGVAHVGLPTNDLQKTVEFYKSLGFEVIMQTYNEKAGEKAAFCQLSQPVFQLSLLLFALFLIIQLTKNTVRIITITLIPQIIIFFIH